MKLYWTMPASLKAHYREELALYKEAFSTAKYALAWRHLERAHIIGQAWPMEHTHVHWLMLRFGVALKSMREILGQIPRLLVGGVKSFVGEIPVGNTGGSNVPPLKSMDIPNDLKAILLGRE